MKRYSHNRSQPLAPLWGTSWVRSILVLLVATGWACAPAGTQVRDQPELDLSDAPPPPEAAAEAPAASSETRRRPTSPPPVEEKNELAEAVAIVASPKAMAERADEARAQLEAIAKKEPKNVLAWYNIGLIHWHQGNVSGAQAAWNRALKAKSNYLPARARLAQIQLLNGERDAAVAELEKIIDKLHDEDEDFAADEELPKAVYTKGSLRKLWMRMKRPIEG